MPMFFVPPAQAYPWPETYQSSRHAPCEVDVPGQMGCLAENGGQSEIG